jgi:hypothetical protein
MIDITQDIQPLTTFHNNSVEFMQQLKATQRPIILTVNDKPEAVLRGTPPPISASSTWPPKPTPTKASARASRISPSFARSMIYRVDLTARASLDLDLISHDIQAGTSPAADLWFRGPGRSDCKSRIAPKPRDNRQGKQAAAQVALRRPTPRLSSDLRGQNPGATSRHPSHPPRSTRQLRSRRRKVTCFLDGCRISLSAASSPFYSCSAPDRPEVARFGDDLGCD